MRYFCFQCGATYSHGLTHRHPNPHPKPDSCDHRETDPLINVNGKPVCLFCGLIIDYPEEPSV